MQYLEVCCLSLLDRLVVLVAGRDFSCKAVVKAGQALCQDLEIVLDPEFKDSALDMSALNALILVVLFPSDLTVDGLTLLAEILQT